MRMILTFDGASHQSVKGLSDAERPMAACGWTLTTQDGRVTGEGKPLPPMTTNNQAETLGLISGLVAALKAGATDLVVRGDSTFVIKTMTGEYRTKNQALKPLFIEAKERAACLSCHFKWVPREENRAADKLCRMARESKEIVSYTE